MPATYPKWIAGKTPRSDAKASPTRFRRVVEVPALKIVNADYRSSQKFSGVFELVSTTQRAFSGKFGYEVYCSWFGVKPPTGYPKISVMGLEHQIIDSYTGDVIDDISKFDRSAKELNWNPFPYKDVFLAVEKRLIEAESTQMDQMDKTKIQGHLDKFKQFESRELTDDQYFSILVFVAFYSGFKAATVTSKRAIIQRHFPGWKVASAYAEKDILEIINDPEMIAHEGKIRACVENAKTFSTLISKHGSIKNYIDSYSPIESFENLLLFKEALEASFVYLGGITVYHFMTDIGLPVLKPDRVMCRIFERLGLLENRKQLLKAVIQGRKFAAATGLPIRYIDIVFVAYGQVKSENFDIRKGICLEKPRCSECRIQKYCGFLPV